MITGSIVALVTPMLPDGAIDKEGLATLIEYHIQSGTAALGIAGTTGESATLTMAEHIDIIQFAVEQAAGRIPVVAGTGSNSTHEAIELTVAAAAAGAEYSLLVTPYYNKPPQEGLYRHFCQVAAAVNIPIILYNVPSRTGVDLSSETVLRLSEVGNIAGLKDATGDVERGGALIAKLPDTFGVYSGDDATALDLMCRGGRGNVSVTANVAAAKVAEVCRLALTGDEDGARKLNAELSGLNEALFIEANPIPVKWAMVELGLVKEGIRLPLVALSTAHQETVLEAIRQAGL
ncbi:4-hydroxy-tetrahydrodipicolinate synthase [Luminiphilus sp.]|jgi:4-hydroxy-tetrahydrodipicolinate synthase|nr:4-hydroxy-tetrahydrodipicolinate synthase [Luminiphilus sp.]MDA9580882.1 4-hydroxy-tetrahydrodipicolinate synthase [Luminiphilus sp.]MDB2351888.1 4-hydroxy-tetrahydrodipicolinate synthase [Luminiphilus sp.]MDB2615587.1 4-hydroxy-tetrahydrodipicolinate synthase [Luminiphilus sp.]MDC6485048.1 4-hydroxy-tetrahydrodipicolinate synthase [Luminiphilus sp.]